MTKSERILLLILAGINFTHIMDFMIMMPMGTQLMRSFNINPQQFSFMVSAYTFAAGASGFTASFFVDNFDRKKILLFGYTGFVVGTIACGLAPTYPTLMAARIVAGLFGGLIGAQVLSIIGDQIPEERRATATGTLMAAFSVASVVGVPTGLYLASTFSWHVPFLAIGMVGIVFIGLIQWAVKPMADHLNNEAGKVAKLELLKDIKNSGVQRRALTLSLVMMLGHFSIIPFLAPYMVSNVGFTEKELTLIYFIGGLVTLVTSPLVGRIADKYGKYPIFAISMVFACIPIFLITNMPAWPVWAALIVTTMFFASSSGRFVPSQAMIISVVSPRTRGGFMSINSSIQQVGSGFAAMLAGIFVVQNSAGQLQNYAWVGYLSMATSLACIWLAKGLVRKQNAQKTMA